MSLDEIFASKNFSDVFLKVFSTSYLLIFNRAGKTKEAFTVASISRAVFCKDKYNPANSL